MPKAPAESGIILPSPRTVFRTARDIAETTAPTPIAPIRKPSVCGPPLSKIFAANTGISTVNGHPIKLTIANSSRILVRNRRER